MAPVCGGEPDTGAWDKAAASVQIATCRVLTKADIQLSPIGISKAEIGPIAERRLLEQSP